MPSLIIELLQGRPGSDKALYAALAKNGKKDRNRNGGLGSVFRAKTRIFLVDQAFFVDDKKKTAWVSSIPHLYQLALAFKSGTLGVTQNENKYAICLALICRQHCLHTVAKSTETPAIVDLRHTLVALQELRDLFSAGQLQDFMTDHGMPISVWISLKITAHETMLAATVVDSSRISASGLEFKNSAHYAETVNVRTAEIKNETTFTTSRRFIRKKDVEADVAGIEVFAGTMMELYIGPQQPATLQELKGININQTVDVLSEEIPFKPFHSNTVLREWSNRGFPGAAEIDVASVHLAEDDYHTGNGGKRTDTQEAVRIDFDCMLAPLNPYFTEYNKDATQRLGSDIVTIKSLRKVDAFEIHADDLTNLPVLLEADTKEKVKHHFLPFNWWARNPSLPENILTKIAALPQQPDYLYRKFRSMLEKIIMPDSVIVDIANGAVFNLQQKSLILDWMKARRLAMQKAALNVSGFTTFMHEQGTQALEELKRRYTQFIMKRTDLQFTYSPDKLFKQYDQNFVEFTRIVPKPVIKPVVINVPPPAEQKAVTVLPRIVPKPVIKPVVINMPQPAEQKAVTVIPPAAQSASDRVLQMLKTMSEENFSRTDVVPEYNQQNFFFAEIKNFMLDELAYLSGHMHEVQQGQIPNHHFAAIRLVHDGCCLNGTGNTKSWQLMRHAVKEEIVLRLRERDPRSKLIQLNEIEYRYYYGLLNQRTGSSYGRLFQTPTAAAFKREFRMETGAGPEGYQRLSG